MPKPNHLIESNRSSGILLHITSLPGRRYNGDLGNEARNFVDFLSLAKQKWWQTLPINPIGIGNSPYSTISSFAGEPLLIDLEALHKEGLLSKSDIAFPQKSDSDKVQFSAGRKYRLENLRKAFQSSLKKKNYFSSASFKKFKSETKYWLPDFSLFCSLSENFGSHDWSTWPKALKNREASALKLAQTEYELEIKFVEFQQYHFHKQWQALKKYCKSRDVLLMGDIPIFVSLSSADVWANQPSFLLKKDGKPAAVAGVPPDRQTPDGQLWGNALYHWPKLKKDGYKWWLDRFKRQLELFDGIRLDHFIGFHRYWRISPTAKTAKNGTWCPGPQGDFFAAVQKKFGKIPLIAEDLGLMIPPVTKLRQRFHLPGMKVLQFGFGNEKVALDHRPHNFEKNSVVYPGTHDNDTCLGWYRSLKKSARSDKFAKDELKAINIAMTTNEKTISWDFTQAAFESRANLAIIQAQDILGLGSKARMNVPGTPTGNWVWRSRKNVFDKSLATRLGDLAKYCERSSAR